MKARRSSVAHAAVRELLRVDLVFRHQFLPQRQLICCRPIQVENLAPRPDVFFRRPMAVQTPFHVEIMGLPSQWHAVQLPVARRAPDPLVDMYAVIEKHEVGRVGHPVPTQRNARRQALTNRRQHGRIFPDLRMTCHADLGCRHPGKRRFFHRGMTKSAINPDSINMMFVAEGHRLFQGIRFTGGIG